MTIYQAMQLNVKNLKAAISDAPTKKDKIGRASCRERVSSPV